MALIYVEIVQFSQFTALTSLDMRMCCDFVEAGRYAYIKYLPTKELEQLDRLRSLLGPNVLR